jgi:hypothetical protein
MAALTDSFNRPFDEGFGRDILDEVQIGPQQPNVTIRVDSRDTSGGSTSAAAAAAAEQIEEFSAEGGGLLAIAYGEHFIAGHLVVHKFVDATPNEGYIIVALGDGRGHGGGHGEWTGAVAVYYAGEALIANPGAGIAGFRFYAGFISTGVADANQPVDAFFSSTGLAYSGTCYIAVRIPTVNVEVEDRPDKVRGRYQCRKTFDFDKVGNFGSHQFNINAAHHAADRILAFYDHKFPNDAPLAKIKLQAAIDWESWNEFKTFNATQISWFNGSTTININRFDSNAVFTTGASLAEALDQICATSGAHWQHDGEQFIFLPPSERDPVHHFDESNIKDGTLRVQPRDLRERPNSFVLEFRDFDDAFLGTTSVEVRRDALIKQVGEIKSVRALPPMRKSQADRLLERMARLESDNPVIASLTGDETSIHIIPGDFVTVSHPLPGWNYQRCLVLAVNLSSAEDGVDFCEFTLQAVDGPLYSDTAHGPRQEALTP